MQAHPFSPLFLFFLCFPFLLNVSLAGARVLLAGDSPFTPKAYLIRYWDKEIHSNLPKSTFILSKASPLNAVDAATFTKLASQNALSTKFPAFCSSAKLFCFPDLAPSLDKHDGNSNFAVYFDKNFTNYGTDSVNGVDSFKNYSDGENIPVNSFRRYGRDSIDHNEKFSAYGPDGNVVDQSFNTYGAHSSGGAGEFKEYNDQVNVPDLRFASYSDHGNRKAQKFSSYTGDTNSGSESFTSYGKNGVATPNEFTSYADDSNVIGSEFTNYGEDSNGANNTFKSYGSNGNVPENNFKNYGAEGTVSVDSFTSYREESNVGDDSFQSYAKKSSAGAAYFKNYGQSFNEGSDTFTGYGEGANEPKVGFKIYGENSTFKEYADKKTTSFSDYRKQSSATASDEKTAKTASGSLVNKWIEPGKFFRESELKKGNVMPMPDIRDKMPKRSFLPRTITSKLPFSTSNIASLKETFHAADNSTMEKIIKDALEECERAPTPGETKRCVGSAEDLIDFATSVLGRNVVVRTTANVNGSKKKIMIGSIKGINGGKVTKSVSCHQSLFPYLLYYCHSVPKVRVYEADILDPNSKAKINHGVAICHLDTSVWSPSHGAFLALGSGPGKIEVCHWIFENDMTWVTADN
ncbi:polygalacturonase 1 beta-like protein 3 [Manihot esculenta]|uniref:BURP domain-containing protein n=2 Tax=Manihot esculenta TaxID=3983 RepID=A0A251JL19_MANES|nr:polygalacturonase 1 beta-like protein 3 [Manihot esculenta]OAY34550.1 hypothetical protein MANES_12G028800v8 [Manihot esculenta]OAY34551.1 hypothetical protein MANES_12G028800v8 [Manihot esculenta]OAY34552.1 hypothetical protein MANES_12G028800v8 [Manihot esculenta]OAY34592.2 hypothetical protein MANES_12G028800v8 [Manihot esculenta]